MVCMLELYVRPLLYNAGPEKTSAKVTPEHPRSSSHCRKWNILQDGVLRSISRSQARGWWRGETRRPRRNIKKYWEPHPLPPTYSCSLSFCHSFTYTHKHTQTYKQKRTLNYTSTHCHKMVCVIWFTSHQKLIGKMPSVLRHTHTQREAHCLLPVFWLINFPDRACTNIKCSPPFLCHTQSVPPLSCVSLPSLAHFSSPGLWLCWPKMSGQRTSPHRTAASLIFSVSSFFFFFFLHLHIFIWFRRFSAQFFPL